MSSKKSGTSGIQRTTGMIQKTKQTGKPEIPLITSRYNEERIDNIYYKIKTFLTKYKGDKKENLLDISEVLYSIIYKGKDQGYNNNLHNLEVILAVLRYLSRIRKPYNKRRIELLKQFIFLSEQNAHTNVFKSATFKTDETYVTVTDSKYYIVAKKYFDKIIKKFIDVDKIPFTFYDTLYIGNKYLNREENKDNVYFISNTLVREFIQKLLNKNLDLKSQSGTLSASSPKQKSLTPPRSSRT